MKLRITVQSLIAITLIPIMFLACEEYSDAMYADDVPVDARILELCVSDETTGYSGEDYGVTGLFLVDAESGETLRELKTGEVIDLGELGQRLSIRAETTGDTASVRFALDKEDDFHTDNSRPFYIKGDSKTHHCDKKDKKKCVKPKAWTPEMGYHTLTVTGFDKDKAKGEAGKYVTVKFLVVNESVTAHISEAKVKAKHSDKLLSLIPTSGKKKAKVEQLTDTNHPTQFWRFRRLANGSYEISSEFNGLCLSAKGKGKKGGKDVRLDRCKDKKEQQWQLKHQTAEWYRIVSSKKDRCLSVEKNSDKEGAHIVLEKCDDKHKRKGKGKCKDKNKDATFWKIEGDASSVDNSMAVTDFYLVNAKTFENIRKLEDGDIIDLEEIESEISVRADTIGQIGSVLFQVDDAMAYQLENYIPYMIEGNTASTAYPWEPEVGERVITATPYAMKNAMGLKGIEKTITVTILDDDDPGGNDDTDEDIDTEGNDDTDEDIDTEGNDDTDEDIDTEGSNDPDEDNDPGGGEG